MDDITDLIARVDWLACECDTFEAARVCRDAADALTAQAATIAAQAREIAIHRKNIDRLAAIVNQQADELEALRADAERLREALPDLHGQVKFHCDHYGEADFEIGRAIAALQASETGGKAVQR